MWCTSILNFDWKVALLIKYNAVVLSLVPCFKTSSLPAFYGLFCYLILGHFSNPRGPRNNFWCKPGPVCTLSIPKTAQCWVNVHDICRSHSDGCFRANSDHFGTMRTFTAALGEFLGPNWPVFWPPRVPKLPEIESKCMISVRLTPVGCLVVF